MPEQTPAPDEQHAIDDLAPPGKSRSPMAYKIGLLLFVVAVVAVECLIAYLWLPSASDAAALSGEMIEGQASLAAIAEDQQDQEELVEELEIDLGEFNVTAFQPISNTTLRIDFHLFATVAVADFNEIVRLHEENEHRFREQVIVTIRSADITDLTDAGLGLIKRKILEKSNRLLGKPLLRTIVFSDYSFVEQ